MAVSNVKYDTKTTVTTTALTTTFVDGDFWGSAAIDNSAVGKYFIDVLVGGKFAVTTGTPTNGFNLFVAGSIDGGTTFGGNATGTEGEFTPESANLKFLGHVAVDAQSATYEFGTFSVASAFGGIIPDQWVVVVENDSGIAMTAAANQLIDYMGIEFEAV